MTGESPRALPPPERLRELWFDAARMGRDDMIPALLQAGVDIEEVDAKGHSALVLASYGARGETTAVLLALGAAVDGPPGATGSSALMGVAFKGHADIARMLIDAGADVNYRNGAGQTALMMAAMFDRRDIVEMLVAAGAERDAVDAAGNTAQTVAAMQGNAAMAARMR